jgi:hypothetical protein
MLHYTLLHHSSSARLTSEIRLYREAERAEKRWHITNQNNGRGHSKGRHNNVAVTTSMIGQKVSRRVRWGHFNYRHSMHRPGDPRQTAVSDLSKIILCLELVKVPIKKYQRNDAHVFKNLVFVHQLNNVQFSIFKVYL